MMRFRHMSPSSRPSSRSFHRLRIPPAGRSARGAALLLVLWLIVMLTAVVGAFALIARVEYLQGRVLSHGVIADQAARAGLEYAMTRVVDLDPAREALTIARKKWPDHPEVWLVSGELAAPKDAIGFPNCLRSEA